jgi:hypothetical protein
LAHYVFETPDGRPKGRRATASLTRAAFAYRRKDGQSGGETLLQAVRRQLNRMDNGLASKRMCHPHTWPSNPLAPKQCSGHNHQCFGQRRSDAQLERANLPGLLQRQASTHAQWRGLPFTWLYTMVARCSSAFLLSSAGTVSHNSVPPEVVDCLLAAAHCPRALEAARRLATHSDGQKKDRGREAFDRLIAERGARHQETRNIPETTLP